MEKTRSILYALLAAAFYAVNVPLSKLLLNHVGPTTMAALLYLGAGIGIGLLSLAGQHEKGEKLNRSDFPFVAGMIVLDIAAPIFLMLGISYGSSNASLLGNFEIVVTTMIALCIFKEVVTKRLWAAIACITLSSILLSFEGADSFRFSYSSLLIALIRREHFPAFPYILLALLLGFVAYGLSIFLYVRAQSRLGAAQTSAYYAIAPFIGAFLSFLFLKEQLTGLYLIALAVMIAGTALVVADTLIRSHVHVHQHTFMHTHDGSVHQHTITHAHAHNHYVTDRKHGHRHTRTELEQESGAAHI